MVTVYPLPFGAKPLTLGRLTEVEDALQLHLPEQYRQFLLTYNGGEVEPFVFTIPERDENSTVGFLFGIDVARDVDLVVQTQKFQQRSNKEMIPIGSDPFGNMICLAISGPHTGKIYFWDHELEHDPKRSLSFLANSFEEFLNALT